MQILTLPRIVSLLIGGAVLFFVWQLAAPETRNLSLSLALGAAFGFVLQRSRFCFFCHARDFLEDRDPRGLLSILLALGVGAVGYLVVFGMWVPVPSPERLPPTAHVGPVSWVLALGAFVFGTGMSVSGSCISAHIYRLGEGSPTSPFALLGAVIGFGLGFLSWNTLYLVTLYNAPAIWLPHWLGYAGTIALTIALLLALALYLLTRGKLVVPAQAKENYGVGSVLCAVFVARWPAWIGGLLVGLISAVAYLRVAPLGVTAELGSLARTATEKIGLLPETLHGLDSFRGCMTAVKTALLSPNGMFVLGIVAASFASALAAGQFTPRLPTLDEAARGVVGGVMMGWGAMIALGCTVGVLLSGIHAGALSGWIFLVFCFGGIVAGLWLRRAVQAPPKKAARRKARA